MLLRGVPQCALSCVGKTKLHMGRWNGKRNVVDLCEQSAVDFLVRFLNIVRIVHDAKFSLSKQPYLH